MIARCSAGSWSKVAIGRETLHSAGVGHPRFQGPGRGNARRSARLRDARAEPGEWPLARARRESHPAAYGLVHGGVYAAMAESLVSQATAWAVADDGKIAVGLSNHTSFMR